jgi:tetratricopeptide (TPR) repeat protein
MRRTVIFFAPRIRACRFGMITMAATAATSVMVLFSQTAQPDTSHVVDLLRERQYQQALDSVGPLLAEHPHDCHLLSLRGIALSSLKKDVEAERSFRDALKSCPENLLALEGAAEIEYARRQSDAEPLLEHILAIRPQDVTAQAMLASFYRGRGNCKAALPHFEASQALFASRPDFQQGYAFCLADTGQYARAADAYKAVLEKVQDETARYNLALVQWKLNDAKGALDTLRPELTADSNETVLALGSRLAEESGDTPLAVNLLRSAILASPKDLANYLEFAQIAFNHQSFQVGIDMVNAGLTQLPNAAPLYVVRGVLEMQFLQSDRAIADFERAHRLAPQLSLAMDAVGIVESQQYKQEAALNLFEKQAKLHPADSLLQYLYAEALSNASAGSDATHKAIQAALHSVAIDPGYAPAHELLALLWLRANQPQRAAEQAEAALKIRPDDDAALYQEIMARRRLGQTAQVQVLVKQLTAIRSQNAGKEKEKHHYVLQEKPGS